MAKGLLLAGVLLGCASAVAPAQAQLANVDATSTAPAATDAAVSTIGDIVVTAQKREQKLQTVPISMEVVSSRKLESFNINDFRQMVKLVPNVSVVNSPGNDALYVRGFGSAPGNYSFDPSVSFYVDGIYAGRPKQSQGPFFDLERVEVLRGPQGALFGKNTAAGAVSIVSAGPASVFAAGGKAVYNFDLKGPQLEAYASGPLGDHFGARLAVKYLDQDGYIRNGFNGDKEPSYRQLLGRLTLRFSPTDSFNYTVKGEYADSRVRGSNNVSQSLTAPQRPRLTRYTITPDAFGQEGTTTKSWLVSGTGNLDLGELTLTSVTGYSNYTANMVNDYDLTIPTGGVTNNSIFNSFPDRFHQFSQELRLASPTGGKVEWLVGGYYDTSRYQLTTLYGFDILAAPVLTYSGRQRSDFDQHQNTFSLFGQGTLRFTDRFRAIGSLRYSRTKKRAVYDGRLLSGPFPLQPITSAQGRISESSTDPSATLQYDVVRGVMAYATYARGSKSGGFVSNTFGTTDATFIYRPEKSQNYEVGIKSTLAQGHVVLNASLYDTKFEDLQVSTFNGNTNAFETNNAARADSKGIEGAAAFYPVHNLDFTFSGAYQDVKYGDFPGGACLAYQTLSQCNPVIPASVAANNLRGTRLPFTSKFSYTAQGHYRLDVEDDAVDATVSLNGRSSFYTSTDLSPLYGLQRGYTKVDARLQYGPRDERWHVAVIGNNLTDRLTVSSTYFFPFPITTSPRAMLHIDQPRNIAVEAGFKF